MTAIVLDELVAEHIHTYDDPGGCTDTEYPDVYSHVIDSVTWFTDRHWVLPADMLSYGDGFNIRAIPGTSAEESLEAWVRTMQTAPLLPSTHVFAATFAGVLTCAGLAARSVDGKQWEVLVDGKGSRVGLIMPLRTDGTYIKATIPADPELIAMHERLTGAWMVDASNRWLLAAYLTGGAS